MIRVAEKVTSRKKKTDCFFFVCLCPNSSIFFLEKGILQIGGNMINYDQIIFFG